MRIESVTAHAFGPMTGRTLDFAPGMTVITGVNESGKSSWHAAILAALVGRRRGKGAGTKEERRFSDLHKPWDTPDWRVSAIISLDDGRRIELNQDLGGKVDCRATDLTLGRDVSADIMCDGSPDASRYLGLDRRSFAATAVVNQAEMLTILAMADGLQQQLQRAADTAGTDTTAAAALAALDQFKREHVGTDRVTSTKPLSAARRRLADAERALQTAVREHQTYLDLVTIAQQRHTDAADAARDVYGQEQVVESLQRLVAGARAVHDARIVATQARAQADRAAEKARALSERFGQARQLHAVVGDTVPDTIAEADTLSAHVAGAIAAWESVPQPRLLTGPTAAELRCELDSLPPMPEGDLEPDPSVRTAFAAFTSAIAVADAHRARQPASDVAGSPAGLHAALDAGPTLLRMLSARLSAAAAPATDTASSRTRVELELARTELAEAEAQLAEAVAAQKLAPTRPDSEDSAGAASGRSRRRLRMVLLALAGVLTTVGLVMGVLGKPGVVVAGVLALAAVTGLAALAATKPATSAHHERSDADQQRLQQAAERQEQAQGRVFTASRAVADLDGRLAAQLASEQHASDARAALESQATTRGLPTEAAALDRLAADAERAIELRSRYQRWIATDKDNQDTVSSADDQLRSILVARGEEPDPTLPVGELTVRYEHRCKDRARQVAESARRPAVAQALADRLAAEQDAEHVASLRAGAEQLVRTAVTATGSTIETGATTTDDLVEAMRAWQRQREQQLQELARRQRQWAELQALLSGESLAGLDGAHTHANEEAAAESRVALAAEQEVERLAVIAEEAAAVAVATGAAKLTSAELVQVELALRTASQHLKQAHVQMLALVGLAEKADGAVTERARSLVSVAAAEEAVSAARTELDRVTDLKNTLELTYEYLAKAQTRVHRSIAPVLAHKLRDWLPDITQGRYVDATVDPATLRVQVTGPDRRWREADRLSMGTAEQVYLLLRVALAQHLATTGETCPLLLDDVTVQADAERTESVLNLLLRLAAERQIILFAQGPDVAVWAAENLVGNTHHRVIQLERVSAS